MMYRKNNIFNTPYYPFGHPFGLPFGLPFGGPLLVKPPNSGKVNVNISKKENSNMTSDDIVLLNSKLIMFNTIFNIIFKYLCNNRSTGVNINTTIALINTEIDNNDLVKKHLNELCLSGEHSNNQKVLVALKKVSDHAKDNNDSDKILYYTLVETFITDLEKNEIKEVIDKLNNVKIWISNNKTKPKNDLFDYINNQIMDNIHVNKKNQSDGKCTKPFFNDDNFKKIIDNLNKDNILGKVCLYTANPKYDTNTKFIGGNNESNTQFDNIEFINLKKLMQEKEQMPEKTTILCVLSAGNYKCSQVNKQDSSKCLFCDKWNTDRKMFKSVIHDLLNSNNINNIFELIKESKHLLPSAMMEQEEYHKFFSAIEQYKIAKRNNQL